LTGDIDQAPSAVSAIKIDGKRSYARVRAGEQVELPARSVTVSVFEATAVRRGERVTDVDVRVVCSSGVYVRALARDLGAELGVGGHLTRLRRTRVGGFTLASARTVGQLAERLETISLDDAAAQVFVVATLDEAAAASVRHGRALPDFVLPAASGPVAMFGPDGSFLALYEQRGTDARAVAVFG